MPTFTDEQRREFKELGFIVLPGELDSDLISRAREGLKKGTPSDREEYDEVADDEDRFKQMTQNIPSAEPFNEINRRMFEYAEELLGEDELVPPGDGTQIALRYPSGKSPHDPEAERPRELHGHLDGYGTGYEFGDQIEYASIFGITYLDRVRPRGGGFTVWPGSHWTAQEYFRDHSLESGRGGLPAIDEDGHWDYDRKRNDQFDPFEISGPPGTLILAHYKLEHTGGVNHSDSIRMAAIRRFRRKNAQDQKHDAAQNIWKYWPKMQDVEVSPEFGPKEVTEPVPDAETVDIIERRGTHDH
ncbi:hypothetical protein BRC81_05535 [Halobacteriales archaeon QS_1_68_20]|nr:MAG: hypothetical protein BRC81_05535 [Halobacteriales archaeon QS_1_68_20]